MSIVIVKTAVWLCSYLGCREDNRQNKRKESAKIAIQIMRILQRTVKLF